MTPETLKALATITDEGLFEQLATAVLREADPLCAAVCHVGITIDGKPKKSPLDGIAVIQQGDAQRVVAVHHTTTAVQSLERKWLHDPDAPKAKTRRHRDRTQKSISNALPGDLIKTAAIIAEERLRTPKLSATLVLTTNVEPSERLVRDVKAAGALREIDVDVWSRSRIAHFLDFNAIGQWIRQRFLAIEAERLSPELLRALSVESVQKSPPPDRQNTWVDRALDLTIRGIQAPLTYLAAESGLGKTVACYRALKAHVDAGGYGLILPHALVETSMTLEHAVNEALGQLHPRLAVGQNPFGHCSAEEPLFILVEDVNRSTQPQRLVEKLATWALTRDGAARPWRVVCPVWPRLVSLVADQIRKELAPITVYATKLDVDESCRAVMRQMELAGKQISEVDAEQIANALGHDPLLLGLHDYSKPPHPHQVIGEFVEHALTRAQASAGVLGAQMYAGLMELARGMLERRRLEPTWLEIQEWQLSNTCLEALRAVLANGEVVRLSGASDQHRLLFRHDRVRDWLLIESATHREANHGLPDEIVIEPFYAEILGAVLVRRESEASLLDRLQRQNPLALIHALRLGGAQRPAIREPLCKAIVAWLQAPSTKEAANSHLRWHAIVALESADGADIPALIRLIPDSHSYRFLGALHNGDVEAGIKACARFEFGTWYPFLDRQIAHVKLRFAKSFVDGLSACLARRGLHLDNRRGLIELCGHLAEPSLVDGLEALWRDDVDHEALLRSYLWGFARCCDDTIRAERTLAPICDSWAALPDRTQSERRPSPRDSFAAHGLENAFRRHPPSEAALRYFISRAADTRLRWQIIYMLNGIDHPLALKWVVTYAAEEVSAAAKPSIYAASSLADTWRRRNTSGPMSTACRELLRQTWTNREHDDATRRVAFEFWSTNVEPIDVSLLREFQGDEALGEAIFAQRLSCRDSEAIAELIPRLRDETRRHWWSWAHYVLSPPVVNEVERALMQRRERSQRVWMEWFEEDHYLTDLLLRVSIADAERILLEHWDHLRFAKRFVQLALFLNTEQLRSLAQRSILDCPEPSKILEHISATFGVHWEGRPGVTREDQILQLEPYIDLLVGHDRDALAQACNENGWFEARRRLFDKHINHQWIAWKPEPAASEFDEMVEKGRSHWIDHEIEMALKTGVSWRDYFGSLTTWFLARRTFEALQLVASALVSYGSREELGVLQVYDGMPVGAAEALIADTTFAVRRRSLR